MSIRQYVKINKTVHEYFFMYVFFGSKGIRQWPIKYTKLPHLYITISGWNVWTQPNEPTNQKSIKIPKVVGPANKKTLL